MVSAYREAEARDLPAICALGQVVNLLHHEAWPSIFAPQSDPSRDESHWRQSIGQSNATTFLAEYSGEPIAFVTVMLADESNSLLQPMRYARIGSVCVAQAFRGKGVGRELMSLAERWALARGAKDMRLKVWSFNEPALAFYQELGFQVRSLLLGRPLT
jgi:ribosomal protein S18 acetylase RimI-like enzyme